jgi:hypothetical protein
MMNLDNLKQKFLGFLGRKKPEHAPVLPSINVGSSDLALSANKYQQLLSQAHDSVKCLAGLGLISKDSDLDLRNLLNKIKTGDASASATRALRLLERDNLEILGQDSKLLFEGLIDPANFNKDRTARRIADFCQNVIRLAAEQSSELVKTFLSAPDPALAAKLSEAITPEAISASVASKIFLYQKAPLLPIDRGYIEYNQDLMRATLATDNFARSELSIFEDLGAHSYKAVYLISQGRFDKYSKEALDLLIFGVNATYTSPVPDSAALAALLIFKPKLFEVPELRNLLLSTLPFSEQDKQQFVNQIITENRQDLDYQSSLGQLIVSPDSLLDSEAVRAIFELDPRDSKVMQIRLLARLLSEKKRMSEIADPLVERLGQFNAAIKLGTIN